MRKAIASTSLAVFDALKGAGFAAMQALILAKMKDGQLYSRRQLSQMTKMETSSVSGRVNELIESGEIVVCGKMTCPVTGRTVEAIKRADKQAELFAA